MRAPTEAHHGVANELVDDEVVLEVLLHHGVEGRLEVGLDRIEIGTEGFHGGGEALDRAGAIAIRAVATALFTRFSRLMLVVPSTRPGW